MPVYKITTFRGPSFDYDVETSTIINRHTGEEVDASRFANAFTPRPGRCVRILMGTKCNFNCSYCSQAASREDSVISSIKDVDAFLARVDEWCVDVSRVEFWGGEPLVYIKYLEKLAPAMREKLPDAMFTIVSNGSLITDEIGAFLAKYRICYAVSHDAYAQKITRGEDPLEDTERVEVLKRTFSKINDAIAIHNKAIRVRACGFNMVMSKQLLDPVRAVRWLRERAGEDISISADIVMGAGNGESNDVTLPTLDELKLLCANISYGSICAPDDMPYTFTADRLRFLMCLANHKTLSSATAYCGIPSGSAVAMDIKGNLYPCQNYLTPDAVRGNLYEEGLTPPKVVDFHEKKSCMNCPMAMLCRGGCPVISPTGFIETCENKFWALLGTFTAAFTYLTGYIPIKIEGKIVRPRKELITTKHGKFEELSEVEIPLREDLLNAIGFAVTPKQS